MALFFMANLTRQERRDAINALLTPDIPNGIPIYSEDHRDETQIGDDFMMSFVPFEAYVNADGKVIDERLVNRLIGLVIAQNYPIQSDSVLKPFASNTLEFTNGFSFSPGTLVTILFKQQMT